MCKAMIGYVCEFGIEYARGYHFRGLFPRLDTEAERRVSIARAG